jgi:predicted cupin superfamily sugar epimerase
MADDPFNSDEWMEYAERVTRELVPMIADSAITMSIVPKTPDVKVAVELGFMILMDKPIIAIVPTGTTISDKMAKVADVVLEGDINDPGFQERLKAAIDQVRPK